MAPRGKKTASRTPSAKSIMQRILPHAYNPRDIPPTISVAPWQARRVRLPGQIRATTDMSITVTQVIAACFPPITGTHTLSGEIRLLRVQAWVILQGGVIPSEADVTRLTPCDPRTGYPFSTQSQRNVTGTEQFGTLGFDYGAVIASIPLPTGNNTVVAMVNASDITFDVLFRLTSVT